MTHDELVSAIKKGVVMVGQRMATHEEGANLYRRTVLAVVELHQPPAEYDDNFCHTCEDTYPCKTIQAIEKELK
jgi:hypothetical protein